MPTLRETQTLFWRLITAPEGVRPGLAGLPDRDRLLPGGLGGWIRADERLGAEDRLDIYANMYFFRILGILKEDFPAVRAVVGDESFHDLVTDYLLAHPSTHPSVRYLGRHLARFLRDHDIGREVPWIADLAAFEWAVMESFDAPDAAPVGAERLRQVPPEGWAAVRFTLSPTLEVVRASRPVHHVWRAVLDREPIPDPPEEETTLRVWRRGHRVSHRAIPGAERLALEAVASGEDFGGVCEAVASVEPEAEAAASAARILHGWFADDLVVAVDV